MRFQPIQNLWIGCEKHCHAMMFPTLTRLPAHLLQQLFFANHCKTKSNGLVEQTAIGQLRLWKNLPYWRSFAQPNTWPQSRSWKFKNCGLSSLELCIPLAGFLRIGGLDDVTQSNGQINESMNVRRALAFVGIEQFVARSTTQHSIQFPCEVGCIPYSRTHALSQKGRCLVRSITCDQ